MNGKSLVILLTSMFTLAGCGEEHSVTQQKDVEHSKVEVGAAGQPSLRPTTAPKGDRSVPWEDYVDLNSLPHGQLLSYLYVAKADHQLSNDQKLGSLSLPYMSESDAFKKQELSRTELPLIDHQLDRLRGHDYYSVPVSTYAEYPLNLSNILVGPYSFDSASFPVTSYGQYCWQAPLRNQQGITLLIQPSSVPCSISVEDEGLARQLESVRANGALSVQGVVYLHIPGVVNGQLEAQVMGVQLDLMDSQSQLRIAAVKL